MTRLCIDTTAWHHSRHPGVADRWQRALDADEVAICEQVRLEILYSARSAADYDAVLDALAGLRSIPCTQGGFRRALEVQRQLAHAAALHHRSVKIADLVIAAAAEAANAIVWHYDRDYDRIAAITGQPTEWIAPRGSL